MKAFVLLSSSWISISSEIEWMSIILLLVNAQTHSIAFLTTLRADSWVLRRSCGATYFWALISVRRGRSRRCWLGESRKNILRESEFWDCTTVCSESTSDSRSLHRMKKSKFLALIQPENHSNVAKIILCLSQFRNIAASGCVLPLKDKKKNFFFTTSQLSWLVTVQVRKLFALVESLGEISRGSCQVNYSARLARDESFETLKI